MYSNVSIALPKQLERNKTNDNNGAKINSGDEQTMEGDQNKQREYERYAAIGKVGKDRNKSGCKNTRVCGSNGSSGAYNMYVCMYV